MAKPCRCCNDRGWYRLGENVITCRCNLDDQGHNPMAGAAQSFLVAVTTVGVLCLVLLVGIAGLAFFWHATQPTWVDYVEAGLDVATEEDD